MWSTINALQVFDEIYVTTHGGPLHATTVIVYYLYEQAFKLFHGGYGAAIAYVLFAGDAGDLGDRAVVRQPAGALQLMRVRLPFSPRHLFLMPLALLMLIPLVWMVMTSIQTLREARHFPPHLIPEGIHWQNYPDAINAAPFGRFFLNSTIVTLLLGGRQRRLLQPGRVRVRPPRVLRPRRPLRRDAGNADGAVPGGDDPDLPDHPEAAAWPTR